MDEVHSINNLKIKYLEEFVRGFWFSPHDAYLRAVEKAIWESIEPEGPILNIGCGDGRIDSYLYKHIKIDVAIDNNRNAIDEAKSSGLYRNVLFASADNLPFKKGRFKSVISNSTFEHIRNDKKAIEEVSKVLKKDGNLMITVPTTRFIKCISSNHFDEKRIKRLNDRLDHVHYRTVKDWKTIFEKNNLELKSSMYYFPCDMMRIWWRLFKLSTWKVHRRELWSYLKDSPYGKLFPSKLIGNMEMLLLKNTFMKAFNNNGVWVFLWAKKR